MCPKLRTCSLCFFAGVYVPGVGYITRCTRRFWGTYAFNGPLDWCVAPSVDIAAAFDGAKCGSAAACGLAVVSDLADCQCGHTPLSDKITAWFAGDEATYGDIATWDVSCVTDMSELLCTVSHSCFYSNLEAESFNGDLGAWDVSEVTTMEKMFLEARAFNADLSAWDVSKVTNMDSMFSQAVAFNGDLGDWDVSEVTCIKSMF